ncbi:MAG TPA: Gfo/Idh/MocA family oxidoreductase [Candidatus Acidoferrales bacterium]|nr:Gfo/Idh/MocA family oxidoreductase [Candidatus Acidoferrales bacterium]
MSTTRRNFLTVVAASAGPAQAWQSSANDRIRLGQIGCGGRSRDHLTELVRSRENAAIVAVCDVWKVNREASAAAIERAFGAPPKQVTRYQDLLAMKDIDAVLIATPDMTHPRILADAVAAGKDVYVEKPFAVDFADAKMAWQAVKRTKQVVQVGTQRRSDPQFIGAAQAMHAGTIGKITRVEMAVNFQEQRWHKPLDNVRREDVDWDAFQFGGRIKSAYDPRRLREWQLFRETTNGIAGLWMCHLIDLAPWYLQDPFPKAAMAMGGVYLWKDGRETSDVFQATVEYNECLVTFAMSLTNGAGNRNLWYGTKGTMDLDNLKISGEGSRDPNRVKDTISIERAPVESHMANFLQCVRSRQTPRASVDNGFQHAVAGCMAAVSLETGRRVRFDADKLELL